MKYLLLLLSLISINCFANPDWEVVTHGSWAYPIVYRLYLPDGWLIYTSNGHGSTSIYYDPSHKWKI